MKREPYPFVRKKLHAKKELVQSFEGWLHGRVLKDGFGVLIAAISWLDGYLVGGVVDGLVVGHEY